MNYNEKIIRDYINRFKIIEEQITKRSNIFEQEVNTQLTGDVEKMIDYLDFPVTQNNLINAFELLKKYDNENGKKFLEIYQKSGLGKGSLVKTLNNIITVNPTSTAYLEELKKLTEKIQNYSGEEGGEEEDNTGDDTEIIIKWEDDGGGGGSKYKNCPGPTFKYLCYNKPWIWKMQGCIGATQDGYFGPKTLTKLKLKNGYNNFNENSEISTDQINKLCGGGNTPPPPPPPPPPVPEPDDITPVDPEELNATEYSDGNQIMNNY